MNAKLAIAIGAAALVFLAVPTVAGQPAGRPPDARMRFGHDARPDAGKSTRLLVVSRGDAVVGAPVTRVASKPAAPELVVATH